MIPTRALTALTICSLAACGGPRDINDGVKAKLDCLAATTVVTISDTIRDGVIAGQSPDQLGHVENDSIEASLAKLNAAFPEKEARAHFLLQVSGRLEAIQTALRTPDGAVEAQALKAETFKLAETCVFEGP